LDTDASVLKFPEAEIQLLQIDSRLISDGATTLFVALISDQGDGHQFIKNAFEKGVRNFLVSTLPNIEEFPQTNFIKVPDTLAALQMLAKKHRKQFQIPIIGVTGSNGKTIVKEWISFLLAEKYFVHKSPGSFNSQIGVPLSIFPLSEHHEMAVIEAGISQSGEMKKLAKIIQCPIGVFTHLGSAHDIGFSNMEEKMREKSQLFTQAEAIVFPVDDPIVEKVLSSFKGKKLNWSYHRKDVYCQIIHTEKKVDGTEINLMLDGINRSIWIPFQSTALIENAITAVITAYHSGLPFSSIAAAASRLPEVDMRLTLSKGINNTTLIHDYYNADLHGLEVALEFMNVHAQHRKKILVLSELKQIPLSTAALFEIIKKAKRKNKIDQFIGIGAAWKKVISQADKQDYFSFDNSDLFLDQFNFSSIAGSIILLKGSRQFKFEKLSERLSFQAHTAALSINLSTLKSNLDFFRQQLSKSTRLMVMVKASAYGSGSQEVSSVLAYNQVDALCVAYIDEGVELRRQGIELPIMVLNADASSFPKMAQYNLEPEIYKLSQLEQLTLLDSPPAIHLKLDTGMNRLGFKAEDLATILPFIQNKKLLVQSVFSHLAASDLEEENDFTHLQVERFLAAADQIDQMLGYQPIRHIVNTQGILRFPQYHFDQVRLGIGLYGLGVKAPWDQKINSIFTLTASISQIKRIKAGDTVGYGRKMKAKGPMTIATVNIGYADGLLRKAGNGKYALSVNGQLAPTVGNICMDMCMIDISHTERVKEGQRVEIFSDAQSIIRLANCLETIPYEVLTNISARIPRIYHRD